MIIRVTIHVDTPQKRCNFCKIFTDERKASMEADRFIAENGLNNGETGFNGEEVISLNAILADKFDDPVNENSYCLWEDLTEEVMICIQDAFAEHKWTGEMLVEMAEELGIDLINLPLK